MEQNKDLETANTLSLVSLITSIIGISLAGIICGHIAMKKYKNLGVTEGRGKAKAGLIIGYIGLVLSIAYIIFMIVLVGSVAASGGLEGLEALEGLELPTE